MPGILLEPDYSAKGWRWRHWKTRLIQRILGTAAMTSCFQSDLSCWSFPLENVTARLANSTHFQSFSRLDPRDRRIFRSGMRLSRASGWPLPTSGGGILISGEQILLARQRKASSPAPDAGVGVSGGYRSTWKNIRMPGARIGANLDPGWRGAGVPRQ